MYIQYASLRARANAAALAGIVFSAYLNAVVLSVGSAMIVSLADGAEHYALSWNLFYLFSAISMPIAGRLGDLFGKKMIYGCGIALCVIGSALSFFIGSMLQFAIVRGIIGFGYGIILASGVAILGEVNAPQERGRYVALYSTMIGLSQALFPAITGWIAEKAGWEWSFLPGLPIGLCALWLTLKYVPSIHKKTDMIDWPGIFLLIAASFLLVSAVNGSGALGFGLTGGQCMAGFFVCLLIFIYVERKSKNPIMPPALFRNKTFVLSTIAVFGLYMAFYPLNTYKSLLGAGVLQLGTTKNALLMSVQFVAMTIASLFSGKVVDKTGKLKTLTLLSLLLLIIAYFGLVFAGVGTPVALVAVYYALIGVGTGHLVYAFTLFLQRDLPTELIGAGIGTNGFAQKIGGTLGSSFSNMLFTSAWLSAFGAIGNSEQAILKDYSFLLDPTKASGLLRLLDDAGNNGSAVIEVLREGFSCSVQESWKVCIAGVFICLLATLFLPPDSSNL